MLRAVLAVGGCSWYTSWQHAEAVHAVRLLSGAAGTSTQHPRGQKGYRVSAWGLATAAVSAAGLATATIGAASADVQSAQVKSTVKQQQQPAVDPAAGPSVSAAVLPEYTADEVSKHKTPTDRVWVTYQDGVYDITDFIAQVRSLSRMRNMLTLPCHMLFWCRCARLCSNCPHRALSTAQSRHQHLPAATITCAVYLLF